VLKHVEALMGAYGKEDKQRVPTGDVCQSQQPPKSQPLVAPILDQTHGFPDGLHPLWASTEHTVIVSSCVKARFWSDSNLVLGIIIYNHILYIYYYIIYILLYIYIIIYIHILSIHKIHNYVGLYVSIIFLPNYMTLVRSIILSWSEDHDFAEAKNEVLQWKATHDITWFLLHDRRVCECLNIFDIFPRRLAIHGKG
jgi:hypothetical protein